MKILLIILLFFSEVNATIYYVSTSGSDANNGTSTTTPWQTLAYTESHVAAGDIIALKKGDVWASTTALSITHGGTAGNPITWDGSLWGTGANAVIQASGNKTAGNHAIVGIMGCDYVTFQKITIDGNNKQTFGITIGGTTNYYSTGVQNDESFIVIQDCSVVNCYNGTFYCIGILVQTWNNNISNITIQRNIVDGAGDECIAFYPGKTQDGATPAQISNSYVGYNTISRMGMGLILGMGIVINNKCTSITIEYNNISTGTGGYGSGMTLESNESVAGFFPTNIIFRYNTVTITRVNNFCFYTQSGQAKTADIYKNTFIYNVGTADTNGGCAWVAISASPAWTGAVLRFYNNTMYSTSGRTFQNDCGVLGVVTAKNNIFYNTGVDEYLQYCLKNNTTGATTHSNNLYYRSFSATWTKAYDGGYKQTNAQVLAWEPSAIVSNPLFISTNNLNLLENSLAINAGTDMGLTYSGSAPDIGAYEFNSNQIVLNDLDSLIQSIQIDIAALKSKDTLTGTDVTNLQTQLATATARILVLETALLALQLKVAGLRAVSTTTTVIE